MARALWMKILNVDETNRVRRDPGMLEQHISTLSPMPPYRSRASRLRSGMSILVCADELGELLSWMDSAGGNDFGSRAGTDDYVSTFYEYRRAPENAVAHEIKNAAQVCYAATAGLLVAQWRQLVARGQLLSADTHLGALRRKMPERDLGMARSCLLITKRSKSAAAVVAGPNDFVSETSSPKDVVEQVKWVAAKPTRNFLARTRTPGAGTAV